jgi:hypothetical protein
MVRNSFRLVLLSLVAAACAACSAQRPGSGAYVVTPLYRTNAIPVYLGQDGTGLFASGAQDANAAFDLRLEQDGCARGSVYPNPIEVCPMIEPGQSGPPATYQIKGAFGSRTFTMERRGDDTVYVDFGISLGRVQFVLPKQGLIHDHPEMVAAAFFSGVFGRLRRNSETQAYVIEQRGA